jgi:hypothetical protein
MERDQRHAIPANRYRLEPEGLWPPPIPELVEGVCLGNPLLPEERMRKAHISMAKHRIVIAPFPQIHERVFRVAPTAHGQICVAQPQQGPIPVERELE